MTRTANFSTFPPLTDVEQQALREALLGDPFAVLGVHALPTGGFTLRVFLPNAERVRAVTPDGGVLVELAPAEPYGLFMGFLPERVDYRLQIQWPDGEEQETEDPYAFGLLLGELDLHLFAEGNHRDIGRCLGAQPLTIDGVRGVRFAVWAPNARRVSVVGDFNTWDGRRHFMRKRVEAGVWELFVPRVEPGAHYKYEIVGGDRLLPLRADPVGRRSEVPPRTASIVAAADEYAWTDQTWMAQRGRRQHEAAPISVYELHAGSWRRHADGRPFDWDELGDALIPYVRELGFTHIELMPIMAHPFGGSWGYQPLGLFAPHALWGSPEQLARFIDRCHAAELGVLLDWVPAHFPSDAHGLANFDGTALYEHADPREGYHPDWNTLIYNLGRREVHGFVLASALHWLERFHVDGLRVDAVASMLYRDYSRKAGEWIPNRHGGRENLESVDFLRHLNAVVKERCPGAMVIAEESTAWPGVTQSEQHGGLGFTFKWNMGWMHDTLRYVGKDPVYRAHDHDDMTFGLIYAFSERFMLPLSHDEVVHGKGSMLAKMPGDRWQQFATLRAYYGFMWAHPGKKLLFMGGELAQWQEWNHDSQLDWAALGDGMHQGVKSLVADLNRVYCTENSLHARDTRTDGFAWLVGDDRANSVFAFARFGDTAGPLVIVCNFTPVPRHGYRVGVPALGHWAEILNTDSVSYAGSNLGNGGGVRSEAIPMHGQPFSVELTLPPLATLYLRFQG